MTTKIDTKDKILDAAQRLMLREGFHGVTVDRLIAEAGLSKGSFFYHFASKDVLPAAMLERFLNAQGLCIQDIFQQAKRLELPALDQVMYVVDGTAELFAQVHNGEPGCIMAAFAYQLSAEFPAVRALSQAALEGWQVTFADLFQAALPNISRAEVEQLAMHFLAILQGAYVIARIESRQEAIHTAAKHFKLYLRLLSQPSSH